MKNDVTATYIALFATSFATVWSSYNTGAAAFLTYISEVKLCKTCQGPNKALRLQEQDITFL